MMTEIPQHSMKKEYDFFFLKTLLHSFGLRHKYISPQDEENITNPICKSFLNTKKQLHIIF